MESMVETTRFGEEWNGTATFEAQALHPRECILSSVVSLEIDGTRRDRTASLAQLTGYTQTDGEHTWTVLSCLDREVATSGPMDQSGDVKESYEAVWRVHPRVSNHTHVEHPMSIISDTIPTRYESLCSGTSSYPMEANCFQSCDVVSTFTKTTLDFVQAMQNHTNMDIHDD